MVPHQAVIVGVSGGPDSLCLLDVLDRMGYQVICAHLNHMLRPESDDEAAQVARIAEQLGVPFVRSDSDVYAFAKEHASSIEEAAREQRYNFLFTLAQKENAQAVVVGHTADDQVETVIMHLLRGSGLAGLRGMTYRNLPNAWSHETALVRPLLGIWRDEVLRYCFDRGLTPVFDSSNLDQTYFRNRIRHDLIPILSEYNPKVKDTIFRTADILSGDNEIISAVVDTAWKKCLYKEGNGYIALNIERFRMQLLGVQRYLVRRAIAFHQPDLRDIDYDTVERVISFVGEPTETLQRDLVAGLVLYLEGDLLWLMQKDAKFPESDFPIVRGSMILDLYLPGALYLGNSWEFHSEILELTVDLRRKVFDNQDPFEAWLDERKLQSPLKIRSRIPGDRIHPLGMGERSVKLADFMINVKMPRRARQNWPLVCSQGTIIWIPGYRIHHAYRITKDSRSVANLKLRIIEPEEDGQE